MKVLITGGAGYIGSKLAEKVLNTDAEITCLDNLMFGQKNISILSNSKVNFIKGDVRDQSFMKKLIKKFDFIIPLAAIVGAPLCVKMPKETEETNFGAIKFLCEKCFKV